MKKSLQKCYENYLGNGNPEAKYWFVGIEPGGTIDDDARFKHHLEKDSDECFINFINEPLTDKVEKGVYATLSEFLKQLGLTDCLIEDRFNFTQNSSAFFTNLYPLKFPGESHSDNYKNMKYYNQIFNIISENRAEIYPSKWILERSKILMKKLSGRKIILTFSKGYFYSILDLLGIKFTNLEPTEPKDIIIKWRGNNSKVLFFKYTNNNNIFHIINLPNYILHPDKEKGQKKIERICNEIKNL